MKIEIRKTLSKKINWNDLIKFKSNDLKASQRDVDKLKAAILSQKFSFPFFIWKDYIIDGAGRLQALMELKAAGHELPERFPAVELEARDLEEAKKLVLNASSQHGVISQESLDDFVVDLSFSDLEIAGLDFGELNLDAFELSNTEDQQEETEEYQEETVDEVIDETEVETNLKHGDIVQLGKHCLAVGDCTDEKLLKRLLNGVKVNAIYSDPPYGMNLDTDFSTMSHGRIQHSAKSKKYKPVEGDNKPFDPGFIFSIAHLKGVDEVFLWGADYFADKLPGLSGGQSSWICWDKRAGLEEPFTQIDYSLSSFEMCWPKTKHLKRIARVPWFGMIGTQEDRKEEFGNGGVKSKRTRPNQKPLLLHKFMFDYYLQEADLILDLFLGTGSTLIAGELYGKTVYGCEIDPQYCQIIVNRWVALTGGVPLVESEN